MVAKNQGVTAIRLALRSVTIRRSARIVTGSYQLTPQARQVLVAQARWIRQHQDVVVRIEGNADAGDTRDHALAAGARRAQEVRDYLVMLGVPSTQVSAMSWGKEQPGPGRVATILVSAGI